MVSLASRIAPVAEVRPSGLRRGLSALGSATDRDENLFTLHALFHVRLDFLGTSAVVLPLRFGASFLAVVPLSVSVSHQNLPVDITTREFLIDAGQPDSNPPERHLCIPLTMTYLSLSNLSISSASRAPVTPSRQSV